MTKANGRPEEVSFYKSIKEPENSEFAHFYKINKEMTMLNLILLNVERWMYAASLF